MVKKIIMLVFFYAGLHASLWYNLQELNQLAVYHTEYPQSINANPFDMRYNIGGCYNRACDVIGSMAHFVGMSWPWWSAANFKQLLERVYRKQMLTGRALHTLSAQRIKNLIVWGGLYGSFHSLVRALWQLHDLGVLSDTFALKKGCYFVFLGNSIDRSAYGLETLAVILQLMDRNPGRIILLRGKHENSGYWRNFGTNDQVRKRLGNYLATAAHMDEFFGKLPAYLKLTYTDAAGRSRYALLSPRACGEMNWPLDERLTTQLVSDLPSFVYMHTKGLRLLMPDQGVTHWSLISCPAQAAQIIHHFFYDSFVIVEPGFGQHWRMTHFYHDVRDVVRKKFDQQSYDFSTGQKLYSGQKVSIERIHAPNEGLGCDKGNEIVVGAYYDADGLAWDIGNLLRVGICLRIMKENIEHGGVNGKFLRLVMLNDANNPFISPVRTKQLATIFKTNVLLAPFGTVTLAANLPLIKQYGMIVLFPFDGEPTRRVPDNTSLVYFRPTYADEGRALAAYAAKSFGFNKVAIFYQDHPFGMSVHTGVYEQLKKMPNFTEEQIAHVPYARSSLELSADILDKIKQFAPDLMFLGASRAIAQELVRKLSPGFFVRTKLLAHGVATTYYRHFLVARGLDVLMTSVVPSPFDLLMQIAREYRESVYAYLSEEPIDPLSFEGYVAADLFIDAVKHVPGQVTNEKLIDYFQRMHNIVYKGLSLNFDSQKRQLSHTVWIDNGQKVWPAVSV